MAVTTYETWKETLLAEIDSAPNTMEKGDRFVQRLLRDRYALSEDGAINATDCAGAGDSGLDALYIEQAEANEPPRAIAVQGKYGSAGKHFSLYDEFTKFSKALEAAQEGAATTDAVQQCAGVLRSGFRASSALHSFRS